MRQFGIISSSLPRSRRWRSIAGLCDDVSSTRLTKNVYQHLQYTKHGNSAGVFEYPPEMAALELQEPVDEIKRAFEILDQVGLIRYDPEEEIIQIVNFFKYNAPTSRKHLAGPLRIIREAIPNSPSRDAAAVELVLAMFERAQTWGNEVEAKGAFLQEAANLVKSLDLQEKIGLPTFNITIDLLIALSEALLIDLPIQGKGKGYGDNKTKDTDTETTRRQQGHGQKSPKSASHPPSPPAKSGQSGGKKNVPDDIRATIKSLGGRA